MKKNVLFRTNLLVCVVIIIGFLVTSFISYRSNQGIFRKDVESVSKLTSEGIYHRIDSIFTKPINISLTMANDSLLKEFLKGEQQHLDDPAFTETMRDYLNAYRVKYDYDSVFLASVQTKRYYYFNGLDRTLEKDDPENVWFYSFLERDIDYGLQIDNDQVDGAGNEVTIFINCQIKDENGEALGVVGVGFRIDFLQSLLKDYENDFGVKASLVDDKGNIEVSTDRTGFEKVVNLFEICPYPELKYSILNSKKDSQSLWYSSQKGNGYVVSRYIKNLDWRLIVENDTTALNHQLGSQLLREVLIVVLTIFIVLFTITTVMRRYNKKIVELTVATEKKHQAAFYQATEQMYENIYEVDITHNRAASDATSAYFESLGVTSNVPYDKALYIIAQKQIKEEYRQGYIDAFAPRKVLESFENGINNLRYDFMITNDEENYYWIRINAHIFYWGEDSSVRMLVYRQNIDEEKRRENFMMEQMQQDSLTELYNKISTQEHVRKRLERKPEGLYAFFILDIDHFKDVNDCLGHAEGDAVLIQFARSLKEQFRNEDIVGRIGGDEFTAFICVPTVEMVEERAEKLLHALRRHIKTDSGEQDITASIGIALTKETANFETLYRQADFALYQAKKQGRNRYVINSQNNVKIVQ